MDITQTLALVFTDQLVASLLFPINQPYIFSTILWLQTGLVPLATMLAILGSFIGSLLNYAFGRLVAKAFINVKKKQKISHPKYRRFYYFFVFAPFAVAGTLVTFLAGFGHMRFTIFMLLSFIAHTLYILCKAFALF